MKKKSFFTNFLSASLCILFASGANAQEQKTYPTPARMQPAMSEYWTPQPKIVTPGTSTANATLSAPSDAIILFDGKDLSEWESPKGGAAQWTVHDGVFTVNKKSGDIQTRRKFENYQLHIEWMIPTNISGQSQGRGNSGIFMQGLYEIQVLDNYENETYVNGQAGSVYKQTPPLANAMRKPGEWNVYDIIYSAPVFKEDGTYRIPPTVTVIHNGIVLQNHTTILGTTEYIGFPKVKAHGAGPIVLQSHGDPSEPISFRNIWIREL
ncbi:MAG: DUF1080 domain-containing protein [Tannerellaceae bacterium]|jgi:hypothetical protein|nr:DUF1080 domain-containing protein [Tannerellaceae bacterium]